MSIMLPSSRPLPCLTSGGNLGDWNPFLVRGHSMKQKQKKCNFLECPPSPPPTSVFTPPCSSQKVTSNVFCTRQQSITEPRVNPVHSGANQEDIPISHPPPFLPSALAFDASRSVGCFLMGGGPFKLLRARHVRHAARPWG